MNRIKVLHLITGLGAGGAEKVVFDLNVNSSGKRVESLVVSLSKRKELLNKYVEYSINVRSLMLEKSLQALIKGVVQFNNILKKEKVDVIHVHMIHAMVFASIIKVFNPKIKIVFTPHTINFGSKYREFVIWLLKPFRDVDILFSTKMYKYCFLDNCKVVKNGIKVSEFNLNGPKNNKFTFLAIGRLEHMKNHEFLIDCAKELKGKFDFKIQIVGEGPLKEILQNKIRQYGLEREVELLGFRLDIAELCNKAHVFVMPSLWEGLPISMLEAGSSKLLVISTPVGSIPDLLDDENGVLCSQSDFLLEMENSYYNYDKLKSLGDNLYKEICENYNIDNIVMSYEKIYLNLMQCKSN